MKDTYEKHGKTGTHLYQTWGNMVQRCTNPKNRNYATYGGKGICPEWRESFAEFEAWATSNGYTADLTIDRIDNSKGYSPDNCRWVDRQAQAANRGTQSNNSSGFIGVSYEKNSRSKNKWLAGIRHNGKRKTIGRYPTALEAAIARNKYIVDNNLTNYTLNQRVPTCTPV